VTSYSYDALNRETVRTYSNGDPTVTSTYDQSTCLGLTACQNIGHPTSVTDGAGSEQWAYQTDVANLRSIHVNQRTTSSISKTSTYYFDLAGNITSITYPTGRVVNYTYDAANRPATAADSANGITYAAAQSSPPSGCLTTGVCYTPQGTDYSSAIGKTSTFAGVNFSETYNNRLQPLEIKASSAAGSAIDITYGFVDPVTLKNAGHVYSISNNLNSSRTQGFTYDQVNRILSAGTSATSGTYCWGYLYNYDAWGNLLAQAGWSPNYNGCSEATMGSVTADGNNHISAFTYDTQGNTQNDGTIAYTYDAESQIKTAAGVTYSYDGSGRRVSKSNGKLYWYGSGGEILAETNASGTTLNEYIFFAGKRIAILPSGANAQYYIEDLLGSSRAMTQNNGTPCYDADFDPYGGEHAYTNTCSQNYKFEGKERDTETGNDDFGARYYTSRFGRWLSADWSNVPVPVPYASLTNPQTLNLYSMVSDDPETSADLDGHAGSQGTSAESGSAPTCASTGQTGGSSASGCGSQAPKQAQDEHQAQDTQKRTQNQYDPKKTGPEDPTNPGKPLSDNPIVKKAMDAAFETTTNGTARSGLAEAGGTIELKDGKISIANKVDSVHGDGKPNALSIKADENTIATFHTHGNNALPTPSPGDRNPNAVFPDFVRSQRSLYVTIPNSATGNPPLNAYIQLR
jgi:RHS repeat-associated protein